MQFVYKRCCTLIEKPITHSGSDEILDVLKDVAKIILSHRVDISSIQTTMRVDVESLYYDIPR